MALLLVKGAFKHYTNLYTIISRDVLAGQNKRVCKFAFLQKKLGIRTKNQRANAQQQILILILILVVCKK